MDKLTLPRFNDMHLHCRQGELLHVIRCSALYCQAVLVMPNTVPAITTGPMATAYATDLQALAPNLRILPTISLQMDTRPSTIEDAFRHGVVAAKLYPRGATTHSEAGVDLTHITMIYECLGVMADCGMVLCVHGECPDSFCMDREEDFINDILQPIVLNFPRLRVVLEHITTYDAVRFVLGARDGVGATITAHHLLMTLDDVVGGQLQPRAFCKPLPKRPGDRDALRMAATSGNPRFFLGSDSAPHLTPYKFGDHGCAGCFTAYHLPALLATAFEACEALDEDKLGDFASHFGADYYQLPRAAETFDVYRDPWPVTTLPWHMPQRLLPFLGQPGAHPLPWRPDYAYEPGHGRSPSAGHSADSGAAAPDSAADGLHTAR